MSTKKTGRQTASIEERIERMFATDDACDKAVQDIELDVLTALGIESEEQVRELLNSDEYLRYCRRFGIDGGPIDVDFLMQIEQPEG